MDFVEMGMLCLSFIAGLGAGVCFYLGLWWTVLRRLSSKHLALWWWASFLLRTAAAASLFYLIANEHLFRYALILLGFMLARKIVLNLKTSA